MTCFVSRPFFRFLERPFFLSFRRIMSIFGMRVRVIRDMADLQQGKSQGKFNRRTRFQREVGYIDFCACHIWCHVHETQKQVFVSK